MSDADPVERSASAVSGEALVGSVAHDLNNLLAGAVRARRRGAGGALRRPPRPRRRRRAPRDAPPRERLARALVAVARREPAVVEPERGAPRDQAGVASRADIAEPGLAEEAVPRGRGEAVLLAEDEPVVRMVWSSLLRRHGYEVTAVEDGEQAVHAFRDAPGRFQLVLMDVTMPRLGGP